MRHSMMIIAPLAMFALASQALAGGADCAKAAQANGKTHEGCTASKDECMKSMADAKAHGWLGIQYDKSADGSMLVQEVVKGSPAEKAGLRAGDVIYALNGVTIDEANAPKLKAIKSNLKPGSAVTYGVKRGGKATEVAVTLGTMPDAIYQAMVQDHMKEHVTVASN